MVVNKIMNSAIFMMKRVKNCLTISAKKIVYNSLIETHMFQAALAWYPVLNKGNLTKLDMCQRRAIRAIVGARRLEHAEPILKSQMVLS
jgi:hypothetical protein